MNQCKNHSFVWRTLRQTLGVVALLAVVSGAGGCRRSLSDVASQADKVPAVEAKRRSFDVRLRTIGELRATRTRQVSSFFHGEVRRLIPEGTLVKEGDPVVWMDTTEFEDDLVDLEANVQLAAAELKQVEEDHELLKVKQLLNMKSGEAQVRYQELVYEDAQVEYANQQALVEKNLAARSTLDEKNLSLLQAELSLKESKVTLEKLENNQTSELRMSEADIERERVQFEQVELRRDEAKERIEGATLTAPNPGYVNYCETWRGTRRGKIAEGDQVYRRLPIVEIPDPSSLQALVAVNEADIARVDAGQPTIARIDALPGIDFAGSVIKKSIVPLSDDQKRSTRDEGVKEFAVDVLLDELDAELRQGMTARVEIVIAQHEDALVVPVEAVFEIDKRKVVYVKTNGAFEERSVSVGDANSAYVMIKEGLAEGEPVALRDPTLE